MSAVQRRFDRRGIGPPQRIASGQSPINLAATVMISMTMGVLLTLIVQVTFVLLNR